MYYNELTGNRKQETRILWIDFSKLIGILLVVFGHLNIAENIITVIYSFHMPLFFFLSGYLEKDKTLKENIKQGIRGLIVPYIILYILSFVLWVPSILLWHRDVFENSTHVKELLVKPILGMILGGVYSTDYSTMINAPLWFIVGLFSAKMIHGLLIKIAGKNIRRYIFLNIPVIALVYVLNLFSVDLLFSINSALLAFPFFSLGYFLHTVKPDLFLNMKNNFKCSFQIIHYRNILFIGNDSL